MNLTFPQLRDYALNAGFTGAGADTIAAIALAESGGNPGAVNPNDPGGSYGVLQINEASHPGLGIAALDNVPGSFATAFDISGGGTNFRPWSTYTSGAYTNFLAGGSDTGSVTIGGDTLSLDDPAATGDASGGGQDFGGGGSAADAASGTAGAGAASSGAPGSGGAAAPTGFFPAATDLLEGIVGRGLLMLIGILLLGAALLMMGVGGIGGERQIARIAGREGAHR